MANYINSISVYQYGEKSEPHGSFTIKGDGVTTQIELTTDEANQVHKLLWRIFQERQGHIAADIKNMTPLVIANKTIDAEES